MDKPNIRKVDDTWQVTKPAFGFRRDPHKVDFPSHKAAVRWLLGQNMSGTGSQVERTTTPTSRWVGEPWQPIVR